MTLRQVFLLALAVVAVVAGFIGYQKYRAYRVKQRTVAETRVDLATPVYDSLVRALARQDAAAERLGDSLAAILRRPPVVVTRTVTVGGEAYVPKVDFTRLTLRFDSVRVSALAYRDTVNALRAIPPRIISTADTIIKYQRVQIDVKAPRRNWTCGVFGGYGPTAPAARLGAALVVGCGYGL